jgi:hypothetical protein
VACRAGLRATTGLARPHYAVPVPCPDITSGVQNTTGTITPVYRPRNAEYLAAAAAHLGALAGRGFLHDAEIVDYGRGPSRSSACHPRPPLLSARIAGTSARRQHPTRTREQNRKETCALQQELRCISASNYTVAFGYSEGPGRRAIPNAIS